MRLDAEARLAICVAVVFLAAPTLCAAQQPAPPTPLCIEPTDLSDWMAFVAAPTAGVGFETGSSRQASASGGIKEGLGILPFGQHKRSSAGECRRERLRTVTLDLGYDRVGSYNGFSAELSVMLPVVRFPNTQGDETRNYVRIYGEPGLGYRFGGGPFGGYASAKVMFVLLSDRRLTREPLRPSPFVEIQRRISFNSWPQGDNRVVLGLMFAICNRCGVD